MIRWRQHNATEDICLMSNINPTTGYMIPGSFVHITCMKAELSDEVYVMCTCSIYDLIQRAVQHDTEISTREQVIPNKQLTHMHCRFYRGHLCNAYERATQEASGNLSKLLIMVKELLQFINDPIKLAGNVIHNGTTKFSVW